jgi:DNA topoisomerase-2
MSTPPNRKGKSVEQIYQKKTQREHILLRPDTYVGSVEAQQENCWVYDAKSSRMRYKPLTYVPGLYKIFDEILVNSADNYVRSAGTKEPMDALKVEFDADAGWIKVWNNGNSIPVQIHKEHKMYVPEMVFGHLLTSDNYDDTEAKITGGRNGYGAKLTNIFSTKFIIETGDKKNKKKYKQVFTKNMDKREDPKVTDYSGSGYTQIQFWPDLAKFGMQKLDKDIIDLITKRTYDIAGTSGKSLKVYLNGEKLPVQTFAEYSMLFMEGETQKVHEKSHERWEILCALSTEGFQQVSFVNSINTLKGGTHVDHVAGQIVEQIMEKANKKNKGGMQIKSHHVKQHLSIFVNCQIENPAFSSQTKETLTTKVSKFGSKCEISDNFISKMLKIGVVEAVLSFAKLKEQMDLQKNLSGAKAAKSQRVNIPKLEDANFAGTKRSEEATLILTEGDSAKSLAVAGLSVIGRDKYGVFPLRGKMINVREANMKQAMDNAELSNLIQILGIDMKRKYTSAQGLRYGSVMCMTDQDLDGSHIKGLIMNMFHHWWPDLCKVQGFLKEFATPIVKVTKAQQVHTFFTLREYEQWKEKTADSKSWKTKYYKGLGTSTTAEAKEYFKDLNKHQLDYAWQGDADGEAIDLAFNKKRADDRKVWINTYTEGDIIDHTKSKVFYGDFINKELVQFSKYDVVRSLPSVVDGFKPTQRKILFCAFKRNLKSDCKVAQFVGYVSEHSAYHHGEASLETAIVNMAQDYVGSNNINLLVPSGQFGTRLMGGKDSASSRYIYTRLSHVTRAIFHPDDDKILKYLDDDGQKIEPQWYVPVIPMVLVNGAEGIGTGYSTYVLNYNPHDIIANLKRSLHGEEMVEMHPWYRGYKGEIKQNDKGGYDVTGTATKIDDTTVEITELAIRKWTQTYKEWLQELFQEEQDKLEEKKKHPFCIDGMKEYHTENTVHFVITLKKEAMETAEKLGLANAFKLGTTLSVNNMMLFDKNGKVQKFNTALEIIEDFILLRIEQYKMRKQYMLARLGQERDILSAKAKFITMVVSGKLKINNRKKKELIDEMKGTHGFKTLEQIKTANKFKGVTEEEEEMEEKAKDGESSGSKTGFEYLLGMNLWSLTEEKVNELKKQRDDKEAELVALQKKSESAIWAEDIYQVELALQLMEKSDEEALDKAKTLADKTRKAAGLPGEKKPRAKAASKPKEQPAPPPPPPEKPKLSDPALKLGAGLLKNEGGTDGLLARLLQRQTVRQERQTAEEERNSTLAAALKSGTMLPEPKKAKNTIECSNCLAELDEEAKFCHKCGQVVAIRLSVGGAPPTPSSTSAVGATPKSKATTAKKRAGDDTATPSGKKAKSPGS